ncbi:hypothetical protein LguiA_005480 [Lonicera macranthoides]
MHHEDHKLLFKNKEDDKPIVKMDDYYQTVLSLFYNMQLLGVKDHVYTISISINCYWHLNRVDFGYLHHFDKGLFPQDKSSEAKKLFINLLREKLKEHDVFTYRTDKRALQIREH